MGVLAGATGLQNQRVRQYIEDIDFLQSIMNDRIRVTENEETEKVFLFTSGPHRVATARVG